MKHLLRIDWSWFGRERIMTLPLSPGHWTDPWDGKKAPYPLCADRMCSRCRQLELAWR